MVVRFTALFAVALAFCVLAAPATAQQLPPYMQTMLGDLLNDGVLSPCNYTSDQLTTARRLIPPDQEQYGELGAAIQAAIDARARGECSGKKALAIPVPAATTGPAALPPVSTAVPTRVVVPKPPEPEKLEVEQVVAPVTGDKPVVAVARIAAASPSNDPPAPVWLLLAAAGMLGAAGLYVLVAGRTRRGGEQLAGIRHAWDEFAWRAGGTWADFLDFVRLGR